MMCVVIRNYTTSRITHLRKLLLKTCGRPTRTESFIVAFAARMENVSRFLAKLDANSEFKGITSIITGTGIKLMKFAIAGQEIYSRFRDGAATVGRTVEDRSAARAQEPERKGIFSSRFFDWIRVYFARIGISSAGC